jgi:hypothetical protein
MLYASEVGPPPVVAARPLLLRQDYGVGTPAICHVRYVQVQPLAEQRAGMQPVNLSLSCSQAPGQWTVESAGIHQTGPTEEVRWRKPLWGSQVEQPTTPWTGTRRRCTAAAAPSECLTQS